MNGWIFKLFPFFTITNKAAMNNVHISELRCSTRNKFYKVNYWILE